ncbi:MAG: alpha-hydroxy acid oxidase [Janthinobacterium lividum]
MNNLNRLLGPYGSPRQTAKTLKRHLNLEEMRRAAQRRLPRAVFGFIDGGTEDGIAVLNNRRAFHETKLRHRAVVDVSERSLASKLFGAAVGMPIAIAPTGSAGLCWYEGELELAKAAAQAKIPFTLATGALTSIERIAEQAGPQVGGRLWFQLHVWRDRAASYELIERARQAKFETLIITVDTPVSANREYNFRNGFLQPFSVTPRLMADIARHPRWFAQVLTKYLTTTGMPASANYPRLPRDAAAQAARITAMRSDALTWDVVREIRRRWPGNLLLKGVNRADDAQHAIAAGLDGVIVSNHGGRNMDSAVAALEVLPEIADAIGTRGTVILDSGIRRGSDLVKALALGARAVLIGRATLYGVAVGGAAGASRVLDILRDEADRTMAYVGCRNVGEIDADIVYRARDIEHRCMR